MDDHPETTLELYQFMIAHTNDFAKRAWTALAIEHVTSELARRYIAKWLDEIEREVVESDTWPGVKIDYGPHFTKAISGDALAHRVIFSTPERVDELERAKTQFELGMEERRFKACEAAARSARDRALPALTDA